MACQICHDFRGRTSLSSQDDNSSSNFTFDQLKVSAVSCHYCEILITGCKGCLHDLAISEENLAHGNLHFLGPLDMEDASEKEVEKYITFRLKNGDDIKIDMFTTEDDTSLIPSNWSTIPTSTRTSQRSDSAMALATLKSWIAQCIISDCPPNSNCSTLELPELPTRVIDVGLDDDIVKLVETKGSMAKYICLSHCWGLEQIIMTTKANLADRTRAITWDALSKTFQDAITLTRTLGIKYIWIDSLCIIQDDARDWDIESAKMASIYSKGHLTIAATHSPNGCGGLFTSKPDVKVSGQTPHGERYCLYFRQSIDHHIDYIPDTYGFTATEKEYPLLSRAWVYQERMLSTRVLHFGKYEMFFECKTGIRCECNGIEFHDIDQESPVPLIKIVYADALSGHDAYEAGEGSIEVHYHRMRLWRTMVCCYTALAITKSKDRLPAVGGLARQLATIRKTRYFAGLWEDSLNEDLLWVVYGNRQKKPRTYPLDAPTWSWASVETFVGYWDEIMFTTLDGPVVESPEPRKHYARIHEIKITKSSIDDFGAVGDGMLVISGLVAECVFETKTGSTGEEERICYYVRSQDTWMPFHADYVLDAPGPGHVKPGISVLCLRMSLLQNYSRENLISLVLRPAVKFPGKYERIGLIKVSGTVDSVDTCGGIYRDGYERSLVVV